MSDLTVDVSDLRTAQADLVTEATAAVSEVIVTTLGIATRNDCWGTDEIGGAFAHVYLEPAEEAMEAVQQVAYQLGSIGERLGEAAASYDDTEQTNADESRGVQTDVDQGPGVSA